jgi:hypothetical protein
MTPLETSLNALAEINATIEFISRLPNDEAEKWWAAFREALKETILCDYYRP